MAKKKPSAGMGNWLREPSLFDEDESAFVDNHARRRVHVYLVPAPWSRVILLSLVYALAVNFAKLGWFELFGRPDWSHVEQQIPPAEEQKPPSTKR